MNGWNRNIPERKAVPLRSKKETESTYTRVPFSEDQIGNTLHRSVNLLDVIVDIVLCLTPLSFVVLAGIALSLDGKPLSALGGHVEAWALLSPTIFPLVFAAVVGRALNFFARLRLEQGSSLAVLEQLVGSQTVFGAFWVQVILRNFNALGVFLVLLWLVSPLGGQSSLRLVGRDKHLTASTTTLASVNSTGTTSSFQQGFAQSLTGGSINALYTGSLVAPLSIKTSAQDTWGNIKIPRFETYNRTLDAEGYATIGDGEIDWISLLGWPVAGLESRFDSNFTIPTWYHDLECSDMSKAPANSDWIRANLNSQYGQPNASTIWSNGRDNSSWNVFLLEDLKASDSDQLEFVWASKSGYNGNGGSTTKYIESANIVDSGGYIDMTDVPPPDFTRRLRTILNTYYIASIAPGASTGTMASASASRLLSGEDRIPGGFYSLGFTPVAATLSSSTDIYRCNKTFFALAVICSAILFVTGVAGGVAKYSCKGPDMLGYITSIVRHNPYTSLHTPDNTFDTSDLARQSQKTFLRLEDVSGEVDQVGHIAISSLRRMSIRQARVQNPDRKYN
ncbi:MAG: hypothetical protein LQ339_003253 [Xanthoria mediterranea]|nr:MAG: hypothetical protein LQ339_003253 [Xanthoria mediterranea]